jgi:hypothetical protein
MCNIIRLSSDINHNRILEFYDYNMTVHPTLFETRVTRRPALFESDDGHARLAALLENGFLDVDADPRLELGEHACGPGEKLGGREGGR